MIKNFDKKKVNPMSLRSKNALSQSLLKIMMTKNFDDISISDITDHAGLSRQTFYTNFSKKEDIINYLLGGLFNKYCSRISSEDGLSETFIIDYFIFWDDNKHFLSLLFKQNMGYLFQEKNRRFFIEELKNMDKLFDSPQWQTPYIKASIAGLTYELLWMWIVDDRGLSVNVLTAIAGNILKGKIFSA